MILENTFWNAFFYSSSGENNLISKNNNIPPKTPTIARSQNVSGA